MVKGPVSAQVMISQFVSSSPASGCVLTAQSLEPGACFRFCVSLSACPSPSHALSLSKINKKIDCPSFTKNILIWGSWVAQSVERPTSTQVMISQSVSSSLRLSAVSSEPGACFGSCVSLSLCPYPIHTLSLYQKMSKC